MQNVKQRNAVSCSHFYFTCTDFPFSHPNATTVAQASTSKRCNPAAASVGVVSTVTLERQGQNLTEKVQNTHVSEWLAAKVNWSEPKRCRSAAKLGQLLQISNGLAQAPRSWQITMPTGKTHPHYTHWLAEAQKMRRSEKKRQTEFQQDLSIMYIQ